MKSLVKFDRRSDKLITEPELYAVHGVKPAYRNDIKGILITQDEIDQRVNELGDQITKDYPDGLMAIIVLNGAAYFGMELINQIQSPVEYHFLSASSMDGVESSGVVRYGVFNYSIVNERDVLLIEDIADTGLTLHKTEERLRVNGAKSVRSTCLLDKIDNRNPNYKHVTPHYSGFLIPNLFVIGRGLDYKDKNGRELYRDEPNIVIPKHNIYL